MPVTLESQKCATSIGGRPAKVQDGDKFRSNQTRCYPRGDIGQLTNIRNSNQLQVHLISHENFSESSRHEMDIYDAPTTRQVT